MIVEANPAARDLVGDAASPVGQPLGALPYLERALAPLLARAGNGTGALADDIVVGSPERHYEVRRVPLALGARAAGQLLLFRDITNRKLAEERLEASVSALAAARERAESLLAAEQSARRELNQFLSMAAHEFKTPLAVIDSAAQMLLFKAEKTAPDFLPRLETIRQAVRRQVAVIETCLADERLNDEGLRLREEPVALSDLLENAAAFHRLHAPDHDIVLTSDPGPPPALVGDPALLAMALDNLLSNAVKYSPAGTTVAVHCGYGADGVQITVRDSGVGIAEDEIGRIFDRYFRASNAGTASGSGVGLNVVRRIARLHGGDVRVTSTLGLGSSFTLLLPAVLAEAA
ncbi:HAMP domain-containing sensor histidine kinase [Azospirillum sp. SYSU D00513]|uniref:sensor histidine kinase n=1 Tax=Azospirillum sp. SYSU D00513 TaxID=2812561 RepID=UPI001A9659E8|nr:HAMP domain-containing sensor histidine kinase [Azospirillum sp. SYSU D00513]